MEVCTLRHYCRKEIKMAALRTVFCKDLFLGRVAVVTGGGTGIGKAISKELARLGCKVVIASRKMVKLEEAAKEMNADLMGVANEARIFSYECNIRNEDQVESLMQYTVENHGRIDYLVNNGGGQFMSPLADVKTKGWNAVIDTNLNGTYYCLKHAYHTWMKDNGGSIVNIIVDMWNGFPGMAHSGAARAAVENLSKSLAIEWASNGIRINSIAPGVIYSSTAAANYASSVFEASLPYIPAKRIGYPEEVSGPVCFLLSPAASYITGVTMMVDGGWGGYRSNWEVPEHNSWPLDLHTDFPLPEDYEGGSPPKSKL